VLHHNNIKEVPEDICRMKSLSYLDLSYNQLTKLPAALKELPLTRLDLSNNAFSEEERKTIESWFKGKCKIVW
jgi:internalin A